MTVATTAQRPHWIRATLKTPLGALAATGLVLLTLVAVFGPIIFGEAAVQANPGALSQPPSAEHIFGTDAAGRDVFARTITATRLSLLMALGAVGIGVGIGIVLGTLPAILPRPAARVLVSLLNFAIAFPALLLSIFLLVILGKGAGAALLAVGIALAPSYARLTYTLTSSIAGREFVDAARVLGVSRLSLLWRHILPNIREPLIVNASNTLGAGLIAFAGLSFLGLGIQPPSFDWGRMLNEGLSKIFVNPATALAPGIAVVLAGLVFALSGEAIARGTGVQRALPRARSRASRRIGAAPAQPTHVALASASNSSAANGDASDNANAPALAVSNLRVTVPAGDVWAQAVRGVSFEVARGEAVGIVGESGSGKSLTCLAAADLLQAPLSVEADRIALSGTVTHEAGKRPGALSAAKLAQLLGTKLAMVFQDPMSSLNPALPVGTQLAELGWLHGGLTPKAAHERAVERLGHVRIADPERRAKQLPHEFSGGMRQRAMIAMGLMGSPDLIIADEPTTALDVTVQHEVLRVLHEARQETGAALLLISHDMAVVTGVCSRVLVMYQGEIVEDVTTEDLLAGRAQHPYTRALIAAVPTMSTPRDLPLPTIDDAHRAAFAKETSR